MAMSMKLCMYKIKFLQGSYFTLREEKNQQYDD